MLWDCLFVVGECDWFVCLLVVRFVVEEVFLKVFGELMGICWYDM